MSHHGETKTYRQRALIQTAIAGIVAGLIYWKWRHPVPAVVILGIAGTLLVMALVWPSRYAAVDRGMMRFAVWVGIALTCVVLVPFFYLCFGTAGVWLRLRHRDPLHRRYDPSRVSYWEKRPPVEGKAHFERQY
jgi:hypothetical protein